MSEHTNPPPTPDEIWRLFRETERRFADTERRFADTERRFADTERLFKQQAEEAARRARETDRRAQETDRRFRASDKRLNKLQQLFESQWGRLMESLVEGDLVSLLNARGIPINDTTTRLKGRIRDGGNYEFDILAHNGHEVVVVEVKTTLKPADVDHFINKMNHFKTWLPRYADNRLYGAMAWLTADAGTETMLQDKRLFSIRATGDSAQIMNSKEFTPRVW